MQLFLAVAVSTDEEITITDQASVWRDPRGEDAEKHPAAAADTVPRAVVRAWVKSQLMRLLWKLDSIHDSQSMYAVTWASMAVSLLPVHAAHS